MADHENLKGQQTDEVDVAPANVDALADNILTPQEMSNRMKVEFAEVIAEPEGTESVPQVLRIAELTYTWTKNIVYKVFTVLLSIILAIVWGLVFALIAFTTVWVINPSARLFYIFLDIGGRFYAAVIATFFDPCFRSTGLIFSRILARHQKVEDTSSAVV